MASPGKLPLLRAMARSTVTISRRCSHRRRASALIIATSASRAARDGAAATAIAMTIVATIIGKMAIGASPIAATRAHPHLNYPARSRARGGQAAGRRRGRATGFRSSRPKASRARGRREANARKMTAASAWNGRPASPRGTSKRSRPSSPRRFARRPLPRSRISTRPIGNAEEAGGAASAAPEAGAPRHAPGAAGPAVPRNPRPTPRMARPRPAMGRAPVGAK